MAVDYRSEALLVLNKMLVLLGPNGEKFSAGRDVAVDNDGVPCAVDGRFAVKFTLYGAFLRSSTHFRVEVWHEIKQALPFVSPETALDAVSALRVAQTALQRGVVSATS